MPGVDKWFKMGGDDYIPANYGAGGYFRLVTAFYPEGSDEHNSICSSMEAGDGGLVTKFYPQPQLG